MPTVTSDAFPLASAGGLASLALPALLADLWFPASPIMAAAVGAAAGGFEDYHARLAWGDVARCGSAVEPAMWTLRTLVPVHLMFIHPLLALKCLDGEMKGADSALALLEKRPVQCWPFFAVLNVPRPSPVEARAK